MRTVLKFNDWRKSKKDSLCITVVRKAEEIINLQRGHITDASFYREYAFFFNERQLKIAEDRLDEMMSYELVMGGIQK